MDKLQPRVWWDSHPPNWEFDVEEAARLFPHIDVIALLERKLDVFPLTNKLMDMEESLGIERSDWIYHQGVFYFTYEDQVLLFRLSCFS